MLLRNGEKVHIIERRRFDTDVRRHFFGEVQQADSTAVRVSGHAYVYDQLSSGYRRSAELRHRIIPLGADGFIINVAPPETIVDHVRYEEVGGRLVVTDGAAFQLDINEFGHQR